MIACEHGNISIVKLLLTCEDIDVNAEDHDGNTALVKACMEEEHEPPYS